jgi:hypothetical protein
MQLHKFATAGHQLLGYLLVHHGKFKLIGLQGAGLFGAIAGLDQPSLIGFKDITLTHKIIQFTGLYTIGEHVVVFVGKVSQQKKENAPHDHEYKSAHKKV